MIKDKVVIITGASSGIGEATAARGSAGRARDHSLREVPKKFLARLVARLDPRRTRPTRVLLLIDGDDRVDLYDQADPILGPVGRVLGEHLLAWQLREVPAGESGP